MKKNKYNTKLIGTFLLSLMFTMSYAQKGKLNKADKRYDDQSYIEASEIYLDVAQSGFRSTELFQKIGNSYYFVSNYPEASKWYKELFSMSPSVDPIYYLRYSQSLKAVGQEEEASLWYNNFLKESGISREDALQKTNDYLRQIESYSGRYDIEPLNSINTDGIEFGAALLDDKLIFASTRDTGVVRRRRNSWDGLSFLNLYEVPYDYSGGVTGTPKKLKANTKFHETTPVFSMDGKTMYFTGNNTPPKAKRKKGEARLKIYRAHLVDGQWGNIEDLSINGDTYSNAHPALSPNEEELYFVSNMPQSIGMTDIFKVKINPDGSLGIPVNLGEKINTKGRESFPFVSRDHELYFSSDGHFGLGGYDVFYVQLKGNGSQGDLINVGKPVNSPYDDVAFSIIDHKGFVSSNRSGDYDDIYSVVETKSIKEVLQKQVSGVVSDADTGKPIVDATVTIRDENGNILTTLKTDGSGRYDTTLDVGYSYIVKVSSPEYDSDDVFVHKPENNRDYSLSLKRNKLNITDGDAEKDLSKILNIVIYFDLDKSFIREDAKVELEKIVAAMIKYPDLKINIRSHTDSQADDTYNMSLSVKRAQATLNYLVKRGISKNRLIAIGYGETKLINHCANGVKCSAYEHEKNRRSEFVIVN